VAVAVLLVSSTIVMSLPRVAETIEPVAGPGDDDEVLDTADSRGLVATEYVEQMIGVPSTADSSTVRPTSGRRWRRVPRPPDRWDGTGWSTTRMTRIL